MLEAEKTQGTGRRATERMLAMFQERAVMAMLWGMDKNSTRTHLRMPAGGETRYFVNLKRN